MAQDIELFAGAGKSLVVPSHIQEAFQETNIVERDRTPTLTLKGKVWTVNVGGEARPLMKRDEDGENVPVASVMVVILDYAKNRGRSYYAGAYDPDNSKAPDCWSIDSVTPDAAVPEPVNSKCNGCPMSVKGSRLNDNGQQAVACASHRLLAVVPVKAMNLPPLRLRLAITSDYDGRSPDAAAAGKFAFSNYMEFVKGKGVKHSASLVTRMSFDPAQAYPKVFFQANRWLTEDELKTVQEISTGDGISAILGETHIVTDKKALPKPEEAAAGAATQPQVDAAAVEKEKARVAAAAAAEATRLAEEEKARKAAEKAEKQRAKEAAAKEAAAKEAAAKEAETNKVSGNAAEALATALSDEDDEDGGPSNVTVIPPAKLNGAGSKEVIDARPAPGDVSPGLNDLLSSWGDED